MNVSRVRTPQFVSPARAKVSAGAGHAGLVRWFIGDQIHPLLVQGIQKSFIPWRLTHCERDAWSFYYNG